MGAFMVNIISSNCNIFEINKSYTEDGMEFTVLRAGKDFNKLLEGDLEKLPMICKPRKWKFFIENEKGDYFIVKFGGFLMNEINRVSLESNSYKNIGKPKFKDLKFVNTINFLNAVPYKINSQVLNHVLLLLALFESGYYTNPIVAELIEISMHSDTNKVSGFYSKDIDMQGLLSEISRHNSQFYINSHTIKLALLLDNWTINNDFNHSIYWRGRVYVDAKYLSPQGGDLARSLLVFGGGQKLNANGLENLKVYTANCYGLDKKSYNDRLKWVNDNLSIITSVPLIYDGTCEFNQSLVDFYDFCLKADEPLKFLSCCLELKGYFNDPNNFISRLPIYLDATCSGLQHLSAMIQDHNLAKHVNLLVSSKNEVPNDVYTYMTDFVVKNIRKYIEEYKELNLEVLLIININRNFIKNGIMTVTYGSTVAC